MSDATIGWKYMKAATFEGSMRATAEDLYGKFRGAGVEVLYDDRDESPGAKFAAMDLIGLPEQLIIGPRGLAGGNVEWKHRRDGARQDLPIDSVVPRFAA